jgi:hypothetical protein
MGVRELVDETGGGPRLVEETGSCQSRKMFVTNHVLSGVLIGQVLADRPAAAFSAGVASHLALDAVPHWGCDLEVPGGPERFLRAARWDGLLGLGAIAVATAVVDRRTGFATVAAMVGAVVLDLDKPMGHFLGPNPIPEVVNRLHRRVQNECTDGLPMEVHYGTLLAACDAAAAALRYRQRSQRDLPWLPRQRRA